MKKHSVLLAVSLAAALNASQTRLDPVVVTAAKSAQTLKSVTSNIVVINSDEIKERGFMTLPQVLSTVSGIQVVQNGGLGQSSSVKLRGFDSKRVLVLIDGVRYNDPTSLSGANFSHITVDDIERIEILKGAQSGVWGADASAGVINIITKRAKKEGFGASLYGEYGSFDTKKLGFETSYKKDDFDIFFEMVKLKSDGFSAKVPKGADTDDFEKDGYENLTSNIKAGYDMTSNDRIEVFYNYTDATNEYDGYDKDPVAAANDALSESDIKEKFYGLKYRRKFSDVDLMIYAQRSKFKREYPFEFSKIFEGSIDETGINSKIDYTKGGFVSVGADRKKFEHKKEIGDSYENDGLFITNSNEFDAFTGGSTIVSESLRYDRFDAFDNRLTYKLGLKHIHKKTEGLWGSFNIASAYNVPTLYQLHDSYAGNSELNPEKTVSWDLSLNYKGAGITFFDNVIKDMIDYDFATSKYANISGKSKLKGVEFSYSGLFEKLSLAYSLNYTYLRAEDKDGRKLPQRAKNSANLSFDYYGIKDAHIGVLARFLGKRAKSPYAADAQRDYPSFTVVDLSADYKADSKLSFYAKVNNLLDKKYRQISGYATSKRAFYFGFRYSVR